MNEAENGWQEFIHVNPEILQGTPVVRGTRVPVQIVVGSLSAGMTVPDVCEEYVLSETQVLACLAYAADMLGRERVYALAGR